ncbi:hypothetical protein [Lysinibacillus sp. NPDC086135]|uniref:hypothetical protein n=1 Tax=Lysinibacillus sp. NPDC086135 TaxID=3364130 RepID=UPI0038214879
MDLRISSCASIVGNTRNFLMISCCNVISSFTPYTLQSIDHFTYFFNITHFIIPAFLA